MKYSAARSDGESALRSEEVDMSLRCDGAIARDKLCTRRKRDRNWRTMSGARIRRLMCLSHKTLTVGCFSWWSSWWVHLLCQPTLDFFSEMIVRSPTCRTLDQIFFSNGFMNASSSIDPIPSRVDSSEQNALFGADVTRKVMFVWYASIPLLLSLFPVFHMRCV